jgi:hypothetical protein
MGQFCMAPKKATDKLTEMLKAAPYMRSKKTAK